MPKVILRMSYMDSYPVEIEIEGNSVDAFVPPEEVLSALKNYQLNGFGMPYTYLKKSDKPDIVGKIGVVQSVAPTTTKNGHNMFEVTAKLADGTEAKWNEFQAATFRVGDTCEMVKNERGYVVGKNTTIPF